MTGAPVDHRVGETPPPVVNIDNELTHRFPICESDDTGVAIQAFAWNWNNFLGPLIYLNEPKKYTVSIALRLFQTQQSQHIPETMAMTVVALIPVLLVFYIAQARFIQGIVISGVKG